MLIGLVTKNGILIVEFANQRCLSGLDQLEALQDAAVARFRPILMTSLSTILGFLPIALALGAGAESRVSMGIAVVGGMLISTLLTLYVVPTMYCYLAKPKTASALQDEYSEPLIAQKRPCKCCLRTGLPTSNILQKLKGRASTLPIFASAFTDALFAPRAIQLMDVPVVLLSVALWRVSLWRVPMCYRCGLCQRRLLLGLRQLYRFPYC